MTTRSRRPTSSTPRPGRNAAERGPLPKSFHDEPVGPRRRCESKIQAAPRIERLTLKRSPPSGRDAISLPTDKTLPTPDPRERQLIQTYGPGRFRISDVDHQGAVLVLPHRTLAWAVTAAVDIAADNITAVLETVPAIEVLLVGCGPRASFLPPSKRDAFKAYGMVLEVMDTGAACRTYNVLLAEGRRVAAALLPV